MDWWKLFGGTFILIFLAELGDKTQLAALAKTADSPDSPTAKWVVFAAASAALVVSTFIAVFLGHLLKTLVPDQRYIRVASAVLFLIFGGVILFDVFRSGRAVERPEPVAAARGYMGRLALLGAMEFEAFAADRYRKLSGRATDPELARLLAALADEEERHLASLRNLPEGDVGREPPALRNDGGAIDAARNRREALGALIEHEEATADFYRDLAGRAALPGLKAAFGRLEEEERGHARRLRAWVDGNAS